MSEKELLYKMIDRLPPYKLGYIVAFVQGMTVDEDADDAFCEELYNEYLNAPEADKTAVSLDDCKREWGI